MYNLYEFAGGMWLLVNTYSRLKTAIYNALVLHDNGEKIRITDRDGNDYTDLIWD